jgi:hypothetical protein
MITRIRRRVHDDNMTPPDLPHYQDPVYIDAVSNALCLVEIDLCKDLTFSALTRKEEFLVEIAATIEMARIRGAEGATSDVSDRPDPGVQMVNVPNLMVQKYPNRNEGPAFWSKLITDLDKLYARALKGCVTENGASAVIEVGHMTRTSLRTQRLTQRRFAVPPAASTLSAALDALDANLVNLTWSKNREQHFARYELFRADNVSMTGSEQIQVLSDNHATEFTDDPGAGAWFYLLRVVNDNDLSADSAAQTVTVA